MERALLSSSLVFSIKASPMMPIRRPRLTLKPHTVAVNFYVKTTQRTLVAARADQDQDPITEAEDSGSEEEKDEEKEEELERLEEDAMAGRDEGREPSDYDRRARIFDESSRVFQALDDRST